jgi:hypothetical protein
VRDVGRNGRHRQEEEEEEGDVSGFDGRRWGRRVLRQCGWVQRLGGIRVGLEDFFVAPTPSVEAIIKL